MRCHKPRALLNSGSSLLHRHVVQILLAAQEDIEQALRTARSGTLLRAGLQVSNAMNACQAAGSWHVCRVDGLRAVTDQPGKPLLHKQ